MLPAPGNSDNHRKSDASSSKSLTPQRKHRKLLKDGSGTEVWPEKIEKVFVQGLRDYWDSPWATYSQSRGRSRWRNQFLVDYLQKAGINRTKKQVASHIQVLRNMWKGESEFYLVAGGEELYPESSPTGVVKSEDRFDTSALIPLDFDDTDGASSNSTTPNFSPLDSNAEFSTSPQLTTNVYDLDATPTIPQTYSPNMSLQDHDNSPSTTDISSAYLFGEQPNARRTSPKADYSSNPYPSATNMPLAIPQRISPSSQSQWPWNKVTAVCLAADSMTPLSIKLDALCYDQGSSPNDALALKIKLCITPVDDIRSPSTLHGFIACVYLAQVWTISGKCTTRVYASGVCVSEEIGALDISTIETGRVAAVLPESSLTRCRWMSPSTPTVITQEIVIDGQTMLYVIYDLDRKSGGIFPSAELLGYQKSKTLNRTSGSQVASRSQPATSLARPQPLSPSISSSSYPPSQSITYPRLTAQPSISCALTPVTNIRLVPTPISL